MTRELSQQEAELKYTENEKNNLRLQKGVTINTDFPDESISIDNMLATSNGIEDVEWRQFYINCHMDKTFLKYLERIGVKFSLQDSKLIINGVLYDSVSLIEFIQTMSNVQLQQLPTVFKFTGSLTEFNKDIANRTDLNDDNDLSFAFAYKYLVALYNNFKKKDLTFRHSRQFTENHSLSIIANNPKAFLYNIFRNLELMQNNATSNTAVLNKCTHNAAVLMYVYVKMYN